MSIRKGGILLSAISLVAVATGAMAQDTTKDVVMRRPLSSSQGSASTPTPTPPGTPTPSAPTPSCTGSDCGPTIKDPGTPNVSTEAYGWTVDCAAQSAVCEHITYSGPLDVNNMDFSNGMYNVTDVPSSQCPATQSAEADELAFSGGYIPVSQAGSNPLSMCTSVNPAENLVMYIGGLQCGSDNKAEGYCQEAVFTAPYVDGQSSPIIRVNADVSKCASQAVTPEFTDFNNYWWYGPQPSDYSRIGQPCTQPHTDEAYGYTCNPSNGGSSPISCYDVEASDDGVGGISLYTPVRSVDASLCQSDQNVNSDALTMLTHNGYLPGASNAVSTCSHPDMYGAIKSCVHSVTYDTGWPTPPASAHVIDGDQASCYALYNTADPANLVTVPAPLSACQNFHLTDAQRKFLEGLAPSIYPYDELPTACTPQEGEPYNYQRSDTPANLATKDYQLDADQRCGNRRATYSVTFDVAYVCTDAAPGDYFGNVSTGLESTYPITYGDCPSGHSADVIFMGNVGDADKGGTDGGDFAAFYDNLLNAQPNPDGEIGCSIDQGYDAVWTVSDHPDQSYMTITAPATCINATC